MSAELADLDAILGTAAEAPPWAQGLIEDLVAEVRRLRGLTDRLREQLQHECPHGEMSWSGVDQTPLDDPAKGWACDNCGKALDADEVREPKRPEGSSARALAEEHCPSAFNGPFCDKARGIRAALAP